ncbi:hypothetical protein OHC50_17700 [Paenarthrobacter ilicis]|uniref:hypothetical protein n=1 Tax=Paenarthrobacter ilicis TaxID=43665 RepID=UPI003008BDF7
MKEVNAQRSGDERREGQRRDGRRRKGRLALWSALPAIAALAVATKLISVGFLGSAAVDGYSAGHGDDVAAAASWLGAANVVEPYKAVFAAGDAQVLAGDFASARRDFEEALRLGAGVDECKVRVNLVLSVEKLGAAAADKGSADALFREALAMIESAPADCGAPGKANENGEGESLQEAKHRLEAQLSGGADGGQSGAKDPGEADPTPDAAQLKQLEQSSQQAAKERAEGMKRDEYLRGPDEGPRVDKPW